MTAATPHNTPHVKRKLLFDTEQLKCTLQRLCAELIEHYGDFSQSVIIGLQPRGVLLAQRLATYLHQQLGHAPIQGVLDTAFHRDDYHSRPTTTAYPTHIPCSLASQRVVIVDDVLCSGRTARAAMDALGSYGSAKQIELLVLVDRVDNRSVPVAASYVGQYVNTQAEEYVQLDLNDTADAIWLTQNPPAHAP